MLLPSSRTVMTFNAEKLPLLPTTHPVYKCRGKDISVGAKWTFESIIDCAVEIV